MAETAEVTLKKFIPRGQFGQLVRWPGGICTRVFPRGHDVRVELHATGAIAQIIIEAMENSLPKGGEVR
jgi:hypothetical protein